MDNGIVFECPRCGCTRQVPKERLPQGSSRVRVGCPQCGEKVIMEIPSTLEPDPIDSSPRGRMMNLQAKINTLASPGGLKLPAGEFVGQLVLNRPVTIEGAGDQTWIGSDVFPAIKIASKGVVLRRLMVEALGDPKGLAIEAEQGSSPVLDSVTVRGLVVGIQDETAPQRGHTLEEKKPTISFPQPPPINNLSASRFEESVSLTSPTTGAPSMRIAEKIERWFQQANEAEANGDWQQAIELYTDILDLAPGDSDAQKLLDRARRKTGLDSSAPTSASPLANSMNDDEKETPLHEANESNQFHDSSQVVDFGLGPELVKAASKGDTQKVSMLLHASADINCADGESGLTPLIAAAAEGHTSVVKLLLGRGADPDGRDRSFGDSALGWTCSRGDLDVMALQAPKTITRLLNIFKGRNQNHLGALKLLLEKGADVNAFDDNGATALMKASVKGEHDMAKLILSYGADVNAQKLDGVTALAVASRNGHTGIAKMLLQKRADPELSDDLGNTPFMIACELGHKGIVVLLLEAKVNLNATDHEGRTALMKAAKQEHRELVQLLIRRGAK